MSRAAEKRSPSLATCRFPMASRPGKNTSLDSLASRIRLGNTALRLCLIHLGHALSLSFGKAAQNEHPSFLRFASRERFEEMEDAGHAVVVFDLNKPLAEQLRKAEDEIETSTS